MPLKIVHCADLHIGATFSNLPPSLARVREEEIYAAFSNIINYCKEKSVDALLICGDLFDCPNPVKRDCEFVEKALASISHIPVFIISGNHDYICADSPFLKDNYFTDNVHIFPCFDYSFELPHKNAVIYGKSYNNSVTEPSFTDVKFEEDKLNIICLHGDTFSSSDYNAISIETLSSLPCNYAAFGHIHNGELFEVGKVKCAYSGTPEGHRFNDDGFTGFIYAEITADETKVFPISLSKRHYHNISYNISGEKTDQIIPKLRELINTNDLYKITLTGEYIEQINIHRIIKELENSAFYIDITDNSSPSYDFDAIEAEESLRGEFLRELRKLSQSEEEFIRSGKAGLDALSGKRPYLEVEI